MVGAVVVVVGETVGGFVIQPVYGLQVDVVIGAGVVVVVAGGWIISVLQKFVVQQVLPNGVAIWQPLLNCWTLFTVVIFVWEIFYYYF